MRNFYNNPFINCTARDMSYSDVVNYWCSPFDCYSMSENELMYSSTPIIIEGARGSGKTMILKHISYFCQKESFKSENIIDEIQSLGYLGIYFRYSADYSSLFDSINCSSIFREQLFNEYFQLCISLEIANILKTIELNFETQDSERLYTSISELCKTDIQNASDIIYWIETSIRELDTIIRNSQYKPIEEEYEVKHNSFLFDFLQNIRISISSLQDILFVIIIDEYENIGYYQRIINTYIKQLDGENKFTFRIGVRPEGIKDFSTNVAEEFLQDGRDYLKKQLTINSGDQAIKAKYTAFVKSVINKRLAMIPLFEQFNTSIDDLLGKKENYIFEAKYHVKGRKDHLSVLLDNKNDEEINRIKNIIYDENPIEEAYFVMRYNRGETLDNIFKTKEEVLEGKKTENTKKYFLDMKSKYKPALLFWLIDKYKAKKLYYSFATYLYLSSGSIYDFIGLCRTVFDELESDYYSGFEKNCLIPPVIQTKAAVKYAQSQLEKVRINHDYGQQMYTFVNNICNLFGYYHKGDLCLKYPETNQFYINGNFYNSGVNQEIWRSLIRWGIIIKKESYQRSSVSVNTKSQLYYVNKSYYPIFGISCHIRGGMNVKINNSMWDSMILESVDPAKLIQISSAKKESNSAKDNALQITLFDLGNSDE